ncbi:MAG: flagellar hook-length control protein FliK [Phycisphaerae bacterium]|nr:flagellar hook-length control protein FliK [Phycisphaerae bacterium]
MASTAVDNSRHESAGAGKASPQRGKALHGGAGGDESVLAGGGESAESGGFLMALMAQLFTSTGGENGPMTAATVTMTGGVVRGEGDLTSFNGQSHGTHNVGGPALRSLGEAGTPASRIAAMTETDDGGVNSRAWVSSGGLVREHEAAAGLFAAGGVEAAAETLLADAASAGTLAAGAAESAKSVAAAFEASMAANAAAASSGVQVHGVSSAGDPSSLRSVAAETSAGRLAVDVNDVAGQIAKAASGSASRVLVIRLDPPHLGEVRLTMWSSGSAVEGRLEVAQSHTAAALRGEASALVARLAEAGIAVRQMEVVMRESGASDGGQERGTDREGGFRFDGQHSGQPGGGRGRGDVFNETLNDDNDDAERMASSNSSPAEMSAAGVNVWM